MGAVFLLQHVTFAVHDDTTQFGVMVGTVVQHLVSDGFILCPGQFSDFITHVHNLLS